MAVLPPLYRKILLVGGIVAALYLFIRHRIHVEASLRKSVLRGAWTRVTGGSPGFTVLENVYVRKRQLFLIEPSVQSERPALDRISMNGNSRISRLVVDAYGYLTDASEVDDKGIFKAEQWAQTAGKAVKRIAGLTYWLEDDWQYSSHYYHFAAEDILGAYHACSHATNASTTRPSRLPRRDSHRCQPDNLITPWMQWRDGYGLNEFVIDKAYGDPEIMDGEEWREENEKENDWFVLDRVILVDRNAAHTDATPDNIKWNKMAWTAISSSALPAFSDPFTPGSSVCAELGYKAVRSAAQTSLKKDHIQILYPNRQATGRRLPPETHDELMRMLRDMEKRGVTGSKQGQKIKVEVQDAKFEDMTTEEQIGAACNADIIMGVHGMGLTHTMWMPKGGALIEWFPRDSFLPDLWLVASASNHQHVAVWENEIHTEEQWRAAGEPVNPGHLHDGRPIPLDVTFYRDLLLGIIRNMA